jgi:uncharacterized membrane protein YidH (DUF202 family)
MPDPPTSHPGLAQERTDLAWSRSGLAVVVCVAVLLRRVWPLRGTDQAVALACISAGAGIWALALLVGRTVLRRATGEGRRLSGRRASALTVGTLALALAAFVLGLFPPS